MDQRISFMTLAVRDLGRTRAFYLADPDGFRWEVATNPGPIGQAVLP